ncbi:hypothetical protein EVAR_60532_1 [Eumeta japonica]|uniref:Uncharacterized protein n=1 Tax=Eumeta variegata TaxID=151549 RepID=A0A4C1YVZ4_EUMVA|nr:hypothetical protein EVAR_60532_1 [Eumeta japonica]
MDADRVRAARIGDPLGVDLTERACRPLIRLSMHPTTTARAARVSEPLPSSSRSSPHQGNQSNRRGASRSIGSQLKQLFPRRPGRRLAVCSVVGARRRTHPASDERRGRPYQCVSHVRGGHGRSGAQRVKRGARRACSAAHTHAGRPALTPVGIGRDLDCIVDCRRCPRCRSHSRETWLSCQLPSDPAAPRRGGRRGPLPGVKWPY